MASSFIPRQPGLLWLTGGASSLACRRRHLKCDGQKPQCGRCRRAARECKQDGALTFRSAQRVAARAELPSFQFGDGIKRTGTDEHINVFTKDHRWVKTPATCKSQISHDVLETHSLEPITGCWILLLISNSTVSFVDETSTVTRDYRRRQIVRSGAQDSLSSTPEKEPSPTSPVVQPEPLHGIHSWESPAVISHSIEPVQPDLYAISNASRHGSHGSVDLEPFHDGTARLGDFDIITPDSGTTDFLRSISLLISPSAIQRASVDVATSLSAAGQADGLSPPLSRTSEARLQLYGDRMTLPFASRQEALLFQHYIENLSQMVSQSPINPIADPNSQSMDISADIILASA